MNKLLRGTAAAAVTLFAGAALADTEPNVDPKDDINVIVVRTLDGENGSQSFNQAKVIPLKADLVIAADGTVDMDKLVEATQDRLGTAESMDLVADQVDGCPDDVTQIFTDADRNQETEQLSWRIWSPWGSVGSGFYGYGHHRYWGGYRGFYPTWGHYYRGRSYPYTYGGYYYYNPYGYHYWYYR